METVTYQEVQGLSRMTVGELRDKYIEVFGEETRSYHREFLRKRIARRIQALAEGDLSEQARRGAEEPTNDADLRTRSPRDPVASGSAEVKARTATGPISPSRPKAASARNSARPRVPRPRHRGQGPRQQFEFDGRWYKSLSAIAQDVTGSKWNGFLFFGIADGAARGGSCKPERRRGRKEVHIKYRELPPGHPRDVMMLARSSRVKGRDLAFFRDF